MTGSEFATIYQQLSSALAANYHADFAFRQAIQDSEHRRDSALNRAESDQHSAVGWADQALRTVTKALDEGRSQLLAVEISPARVQPGVPVQREAERARTGLDQAQRQASGALAALNQAKQRLLEIRGARAGQRRRWRRLALGVGGAVVVLALGGAIIYAAANRPTEIATSGSGAPLSNGSGAQPTSRSVGQATSVPVAASTTPDQPNQLRPTDVTQAHIAAPPAQPSAHPAGEAKNLTSRATVSASSVLAPEKTAQFGLVRFDPSNVLDRDPATSWVEGVRQGSGIGEQLVLTFPQLITVTRLGFDIGFDRDDRIFAANNRVRRARLIFSDGSTQTVDFLDQRGMQYPAIAPVATTSIVVVIDDIYRGSSYDDTPIAEVEVWGYETL